MSVSIDYEASGWVEPGECLTCGRSVEDPVSSPFCSPKVDPCQEAYLLADKARLTPALRRFLSAVQFNPGEYPVRRRMAQLAAWRLDREELQQEAERITTEEVEW